VAVANDGQQVASFASALVDEARQESGNGEVEELLRGDE
jgi:hypothetical protein